MLLLLSLACGPSDQGIIEKPEVEAPPVTFGTVSGRVCDPSGYTWLAGATIYANVMNASGGIEEVKVTTSDADGRWTLEVPAGEATVMVQKGAALIETLNIEVADGQELQLEEPACFDPQTVEIAVVSGNYDDFDQILDHMGISTYVLIDGTDENEVTSFFLNPETMASYDIIFINGGVLEEGVITPKKGQGTATPDQIKANIATFVAEGGSLYASDWAYDFVEQIWPDAVDFLGADNQLDAAQLGTAQKINAAISNYALAEYMGIDSEYLPVSFDLPVWPPMVSAGRTVSVHLTGSVEYRENGITMVQSSSPVLVSFSGGKGRVVFSSFRMVANDNEELIKIMKYVMFRL